jgi:hypothetical protein
MPRSRAKDSPMAYRPPPLPPALRPRARHIGLALAALVGAALVSWWALAGSTGGWFAVGAQVVSSRDSRDAIDRIALPTPLRDGQTSARLPQFHTFMGSPD